MRQIFLLEMELEKSFPKLIACDDKQGNIYLVEVEYTWIPSTCVRCGNLGHKEKICRLPPNTPQTINNIDRGEDTSIVPVVNIEYLSQTSSPMATTLLKESATTDTQLGVQKEISNDQDLPPVIEDPVALSHLRLHQQDTSQAKEVPLQQQDTSQAKEVPLPETQSITTQLAGGSLAPSSKKFMETSPSNINISEKPFLEDDALIDSPLVIQDCGTFATSDLGSGFEIGISQRIRGERSIKPTKKSKTCNRRRPTRLSTSLPTTILEVYRESSQDLLIFISRMFGFKCMASQL